MPYCLYCEDGYANQMGNCQMNCSDTHLYHYYDDNNQVICSDHCPEDRPFTNHNFECKANCSDGIYFYEDNSTHYCFTCDELFPG